MPPNAFMVAYEQYVQRRWDLIKEWEAYQNNNARGSPRGGGAMTLHCTEGKSEGRVGAPRRASDLIKEWEADQNNDAEESDGRRQSLFSVNID